MPLVASRSPLSVISAPSTSEVSSRSARPSSGPSSSAAVEVSSRRKCGCGDHGRRGNPARGPSRRRVQDVVVPHAVLHEAALVVPGGRDPRVSDHADGEPAAVTTPGVCHAHVPRVSVPAVSDRSHVAGEAHDRRADLRAQQLGGGSTAYSLPTPPRSISIPDRRRNTCDGVETTPASTRRRDSEISSAEGTRQLRNPVPPQRSDGRVESAACQAAQVESGSHQHFRFLVHSNRSPARVAIDLRNDALLAVTRELDSIR